MSNDLRFIRTNRNEKDFYSLMGWFFGSREVAKDLGMPVFDDLNREWVVALDGSIPVACSSIEFLKTKGKAVMKSGWVHPDYRGRQVYNRMFEERIRIAMEGGIKQLGATVTDKSFNTHLRNGFREIGMRGKYHVMRRELTPNV